jgi:hypothetical protein
MKVRTCGVSRLTIRVRQMARQTSNAPREACCNSEPLAAFEIFRKGFTHRRYEDEVLHALYKGINIHRELYVHQSIHPSIHPSMHELMNQSMHE